MRKILLYVAAYGKYLVFLGVGAILFAIYGLWAASGDNAYTQRDQLQTVSGFVEEASEVTVTGKRGRTKEKYYQINVTPEGGGETLELRIRHNVPVSWVENLIEENVTILYNASNNVYEAAIQGEAPELTYEGTRDHLIAEAKSTAEIVGSVWWWFFSALMLALGIGSFVLQRKLEAKQDEE
jgi:hypothetical protein